jgi:hypothetical protein
MATITARTVKTTPIAMDTGPKNLLLARASASSSRCFFIAGANRTTGCAHTTNRLYREDDPRATAPSSHGFVLGPAWAASP